MTVLGVDLSLDALRVQARDETSGDVLHDGCVPLPADAGHDAWWAAWSTALAEVGAALDRREAGPIGAVAATGDGGRLLALDEAGTPVHRALAAGDDATAPDAGWLRSQLAGGDAAWAQAIGSLPLPSHTLAKLSWLHRSDADGWAAMRHVCVPHDWLTWRLTGAWVTDRGTASSTGYWSPSSGAYRWDLLDVVDGSRDWTAAVPRVCDPVEPAGRSRIDGAADGGALVGPGTGRPMAAALAFDLLAGDVAVDLERRAALAVCDGPVADPSGVVTCAADATGRFLLSTPLPGSAVGDLSAAVDALRSHLHDVGPGRIVLHGATGAGLAAQLGDALGSEVSRVAIEHPGVTGACIQAAAVLARQDPSAVRAAWSPVLDLPT